MALEGTERKRADELVLDAIQKLNNDERPIRAAGYLKLQSAIPLLEAKLLLNTSEIDKSTNSSIVWSLLKIKGDKKHLDALIDIVTNKSSVIENLRRDDAIDLLAEFGKEPTVIESLLTALIDEDSFISNSARLALQKIFKDNITIFGILDLQNFSFSQILRKELVKKIRNILND